MSNDYLREADRRVMEHLEDVFGFRGHSHDVYDAGDPEGREFVGMAEAQAGHTINHDFLKSDSVSLFHGGEEAGAIYSIVMLNVERGHYLLHLGEQLTHCEHYLAHGGAEKPEDYEGRFHRAFRAMLGTLGMHSVYEGLLGPGERPRIWVSEPGDGSLLSVPNYVGSQLAEQLVTSGMDIPYGELFGAENHTEGMMAFRRIAKPTVVVASMDPQRKVRAEIIGAFAAMGLDTSVLSFSHGNGSGGRESQKPGR